MIEWTQVPVEGEYSVFRGLWKGSLVILPVSELSGLSGGLWDCVVTEAVTV